MTYSCPQFRPSPLKFDFKRLRQARSEALHAVEAVLVRARDVSRERRLAEDTNAPLVAFLASLLLRIAADEALAGASGSRKLRCAALRTLRCLMEAVDDPAALSCILPGTASGLAKALLAGGPPLCPSKLASIPPIATLCWVLDCGGNEQFCTMQVSSCNQDGSPEAPHERPHHHKWPRQLCSSLFCQGMACFMP